MVPTQAKDSSADDGGTLQGRITCKKPAAQTFPPAIKKCEESRFGDDGCIVVMDLSQIELRVAALLSGDPTLVKAYVDGLDLHRDRAIQVYGPDIVDTPGFGLGDMRVDPRQWAKQLNFADLFLAAAKRMQKTILELSGRLLPIKFFKNIELSRPVIRPGLVRWQIALAESAEKDGHLILPFTGQSRYFTGFRIDRNRLRREGVLRGMGGDQKDLISEVVNFPVQTTAGNTLLRIQAHLHWRGLPHINSLNPPCYMFLNTYDSLSFDCKLSWVPNLKAAITAAVEHVATQDYWAWLQDRTGRTIPLKYGLAIHERRLVRRKRLRLSRAT